MLRANLKSCAERPSAGSRRAAALRTSVKVNAATMQKVIAHSHFPFPLCTRVRPASNCRASHDARQRLLSSRALLALHLYICELCYGLPTARRLDHRTALCWILVHVCKNLFRPLSHVSVPHECRPRPSRTRTTLTRRPRPCCARALTPITRECHAPRRRLPSCFFCAVQCFCVRCQCVLCISYRPEIG